MLLFSIVMCVFVLLGERVPMWLGIPRLKLLFWKKSNPRKDLWAFKILFHLCKTIEQIVKNCILSKYVGTIVSRQRKEVTSLLSSRIAYYSLVVWIMCVMGSRIESTMGLCSLGRDVHVLILCKFAFETISWACESGPECFNPLWPLVIIE